MATLKNTSFDATAFLAKHDRCIFCNSVLSVIAADARARNSWRTEMTAGLWQAHPSRSQLNTGTLFGIGVERVKDA